MKFFPIIPDIAVIAILLLLIGAAVFCGFNNNYRRISNFRRIAIAILVLFSLMRPTIVDVETERYINKLNVYFVIDNTGSMATKDMIGGKYRYEQVRDDIIKYVDLFAGAKFSAFVCDYDIYQAVPLSGSTSAILGFAKNLKPKDNSISSWTNLEELLNASADRIEVYNKNNPDRASIVIIMSDGEESGSNEGFLSEVPEKLLNNIVGGAVIGYGRVDNNVKVAKIENNEITKDYIDHVSKMDVENLNNIATKLNLNYYDREATTNLFDNNARYLSQFSRYVQEGDINSRLELYWVLAIVILALLLWDFSDILNELFSERKVK